MTGQELRYSIVVLGCVGKQIRKCVCANVLGICVQSYEHKSYAHTQTAQKYLFARVGLYTSVEVEHLSVCASVFLSTCIRGGLLGKGTVEDIRRFPIMTDC